MGKISEHFKIRPLLRSLKDVVPAKNICWQCLYLCILESGLDVEDGFVQVSSIDSIILVEIHTFHC